MRHLRLSEAASEDINSIWHYSAEAYNLEQAIAYSALLQQAFDDIEEDPERPASRQHPEWGPQVRSYHISLSKFRSGTGIKSPRHIVIYTLQHEEEIFVLRILHERMESREHLPKD